MISKVCYRLPYHDHFVQLTQQQSVPQTFLSLTDLNGKSGFVMAPFCATEAEPILLLHPDKVENIPVGQDNTVEDWCIETPSAEEGLHEQRSYHADFEAFHQQLADHHFAKIVLARQEECPCSAKVDPERLFLKACNVYPRMFVVLISTPQTGTWLMATPEILLAGDGMQWNTMALAGTMNLQGEQLMFDNPPVQNRMDRPIDDMVWSEKNRLEQRYVASFIHQRLEDFSSKIVEGDVYSVRAGNLVHLRSDFSFTLNDIQQIGTLLEKLHPTPAVCGLPKDETRQFILKNEHEPRHYYSGLTGWLNPDGETFLYVTLRCMQLKAERCRFFAGGGLLLDSEEQQEWEETEAKMETMKQLFNTSPSLNS